MLQILLLILKIIGIIIAVILGILVLLVSVVLSAPIRYQGEGGSDGTVEGIYGRIKVTWVLRLVSFLAVYENQTLQWRFRVAWKRISQENEMEEKVDADETDQESRLEEKKKTAAKVEEAVEKSEKVSEKVKEQPQVQKTMEEERKESKKAVEENKTRVIRPKEGNAEGGRAAPEEGPSVFQKISGRIRRLFKRSNIHLKSCVVE